MKKIALSVLIITLFTVLAWVYLPSEQSPSKEAVIEQAAIEIDASVNRKVDQGETGQVDFDYRNPKSWGDPTGWDSDGNPTGYRLVMPNGDIRTVSPFHGALNTTLHPIHSASASNSVRYQHWHMGAAALPLIVYSCVENRWKQAINKYISVWNQSPFISLIAQPYPGPGSNGIDCFENEIHGAITITSFDFDDVWGESVYAGYAFGTHDSDGHMESGLITLNNGKDWFDEKVNPRDVANAWRDVTVCHELGHTLGLGHNDEDKDTITNTCMDYTRSPFPSMIPNDHDFEHISEAYDHSHERMGVACTLGEPLAGSTALYGLVSADDFFKTPQSPEKKTSGNWVIVSRWNGSELGSLVRISQSKESPLFNQEEYNFNDTTTEYEYGMVDPGPDHSYYEAFSSEQEAQMILDAEIEQYVQMGFLEGCGDWKVHLPDLLWDTNLKYHPLNSPELHAKQQQVKEDMRGE